MALTQNERRALIEARKYIKAGSESFVCLALRIAAYYEPELAFAADRLCSYISEMLGSSAFLSGWQHSHGIFHDAHQQRADRLAWIDWMLNEPKEQ